MPRPPASQTNEVIQKFAIVTHTHQLPLCTPRTHASKCKKSGILLSCKKVGYRVLVDRSKGDPVRVVLYHAVCTHLLR